MRFGIIGIGMQGSGLLSTRDHACPASSVSALLIFTMAATSWPKKSPEIRTCRPRGDYQELLDRKEIDCIVAAVPDHWHKRVVVDACNAGKDIYCEKPMSHTRQRGL